MSRRRTRLLHDGPTLMAVLLALFVVDVERTGESADAYRMKMSVYDDSRDVTVFLNDVHLSKDFGPRWSVTLNQEFDAVSSGSKGCTICHRRGASTSRADAELTARYVVDPKTNTAVSATGYGGVERDYTGSTVGIGVTRDFFGGNTTVAGNYAFSHDNPHPHGWHEDEDELRPRVVGPLIGTRVTSETKQTHRAGLAWTQVLTRKTVMQWNAEQSWVSGYQSNPYHVIPFDGASFFESHPDRRTRRAVAGHVSQALDSHTFVKGSYRLYDDTWGVRSHTTEAGISRYLFDKDLLVNVGYRRYTQTGADFYAESYSAPQAHMTDDYRLGPFSSNAERLKLVYTPQIHTSVGLLQNLRLDVGVEHYATDSGFQLNLWQLGASGGF